MTKTLIARPEHKGITLKSRKFDKKTGLFTGVSAAALMLGVVGNDALAAGTTITKPTTSFTVGTKQQFDFIDIEAPVTNDVVNNGTVGVGNPAIIVDGNNGGRVGGDIVNNGTISGTKAGIVVSGTSKADPLGGMIINNGQINVVASVTKPSSAFGIVVSGPAVFSSVSNNGTLNVSATGLGGSGVHTAVGVLFLSGGPLVTNVNNNGVMDVDVVAPGSGFNVGLAAGVVGLNFSGASQASNVVVNSGLMDIDAVAFGTGAGGINIAAAAGAFNFVGATSGATTNLMSFSNTISATLSVNARATSTLGAGATDLAFALGVGQIGFGGQNITQNITNNGDFNVGAFAGATGTTNAQIAIAVGTVQFASGTGATGSITQNMVNSASGSLNVSASAVASLSISANAAAIALGAPQLAFGGTSISQNMTNSGNFSVTANAFAHNAGFGNASALAAGALQVASGSGVNTLSVVNASTGSFNVAANAVATKNVTFASANAGGFATTTTFGAFLPGVVGVSQSASGGTSNSVSFANNGNLTVNAFASATGSNAFADAAVQAINQSAGGGGVGSASIFNGGTINISASAIAVAFSSATARAGATTNIVNMSVFGGSSAAATFSNTATFSVDFDAFALDLNGDASAVAGISGSTSATVVNMNASSGGTSTVTFSNSGLFAVDIDATATASTKAFALARIGNDLLDMSAVVSASGTAVGSANFVNSGTMSVDLSAAAVATKTFSTGVAKASAVMRNFVQQNVNIAGGPATAIAFVANNGTFNADLKAFASGTKANARANMNDIVEQDAQASGSTANASTTFSNTSLLSINIDIDATAIATKNGAFATASMDDIIDQFAMAAGSSSAVASASATNSGAINADVNAFANGQTKAFAWARNDDDLVDQSVNAAASTKGSVSTATAFFGNSGTFVVNIGASAVANTKAVALATISDQGIEQSAFASGPNGVAVASISNTGNFSVNLSAFASGSKAFATANLGSATSVGTSSHNIGFVGQRAFGNNSATVNLTNNGNMSVNIDAVALASNNTASAFAFMTNNNSTPSQVHGFYQSASATGGGGVGSTASTTFTNNSTILFDLNATATGTKAFAFATIDGDVFEADARQAETASVSFTNAGSFTASLSANALATTTTGLPSSATAKASYRDEVFNMRATGTGSLTSSATTNFTNSGNIVLDAVAHATGSKARADAEFDDEIFDLDATNANNSSVIFNNTGLIAVNMTAVASGTKNRADAEAQLDDQFMDADAVVTTSAVGTAFVSVNNSGTVALFASASAVGGSWASADATFEDDLFEVRAFGAAGTATNNFTNSGTLMATALAFASASTKWASADANFDDKIVEQDASASSGAAGSVATVNFDNSGSIVINAQATALAGSSGDWARADATLDDEIVDQRAFAETASTDFVNSGTMSVNLTALASAPNSWASADATFDDTMFNLSANAAASSFGTAGVATQNFTNSNTGSILLFASASALGSSSASANATIEEDFFNLDARGHTATSNFTNNGIISATLLAFASATNGSASAEATFDDSIVDQNASSSSGTAGSVATANFTNTGTISLVAGATAIAVGNGSTGATAEAEFDNEIVDQNAYGETATVNFTNSGLLSVTLTALASGVSTYASADNTFENPIFDQNANANAATFGSAGVGTANFTNTSSGSILLFGQVSAFGSSFASAEGSFDDEIFELDARGHTASTTFINDGTINVTLLAFASATNGTASAHVSFDEGLMDQSASRGSFTSAGGGSSTATLTNTSSFSLNILGSAKAFGTTDAHATASVSQTYIFQGAFNNETVSNTINNSGSMNLVLDALAVATTGHPFASAFVERGIYQSATATGGTAPSASNVINNTVGPPSTQNGSIVMDVKARAVGTSNATANASIETAVWQYAQGSGEVSNLFNNNTGSFKVLANAFASASSGFVTANALASRVWQTVNPSSSSASATNIFQNKNSASFMVDAKAVAVNASTDYAIANATALGVLQTNTNTGTQPVFRAVFVNADEDNFKEEPSTLFQVMAFASAAGGTITNSANAFASGYNVSGDVDSNPVLDVTNNSTFRVHATAIGSTAVATAIGMNFVGGKLDGTINNGGLIDIQASAPGGSALAIGVGFDADVNNTTFINTGTINILAIGSTTAIGVGYIDSFTKTKGSPEAFTATSLDHATFINDGGTIWAGENNGTLDFGTAIDTTGAPNAVWINLMGTVKQGNIWGNIEISGDDMILVTNGKTMFTGNVNASGTMTGALTIGSGGTLTLASTGTGGAQVNVDTYTQTASGTLAFNVTPSTPSTGLGQVYARTASLAGTVQLNVVPGLYANSQTYQDIVVASSSLSGSFTNTLINTNTPLLSLTATQPGDGTVDLTLTRNSFASPAGLTINQRSAGLGLDGGYSTALTGAFGSMVSNLFTLSSAAYVGALEQLHGSEHVQNLRSNLWSVNLLNYALDERVNSGAFSNDGTNNSDSIIRRGETTFWASYQGTDGDLEGDVEASGYDITQNGFYAGFDHSISDDILIGFAAGFYRSKLNFTNGTGKDDEGVQLAVYGAYDNQDFYVRGNFALGYYNADVNRQINLPTQIGTARGDYNVNVMSFHAEAGKRLELRENIFVTPFLGFTYTSAENKAFTETGLTGANLALPENKVKSFTGDIGARFAASYQTGSRSIIIPEVSVRYRHEFKDEILSINSSFASAAGSGFSVISSAVDSGSFIVGGGVRFSRGDKLEISLMYSGRFNSQVTEHGIGLRLSLLLGSRK